MKETSLTIGMCLYQRFISHMVQMKAENEEGRAQWEKVFISHMVQMKGCKKYLNALSLASLYPTWFR